MRYGFGKLLPWVVVAASLLSACSSSSNVLQTWADEGDRVEAGTSNSPKYQTLKELMDSLGYQGVGFQYESAETLDLLIAVFSNPAVAGRRLRLVYTGMALSYDERHGSLTIGGTRNAAAIVAYIQKHVPAK